MAEARAAKLFTVGPEDTALALGSGDVAVLATPRILAWLEAATVAVANGLITAGQTTVGIEVSLRHLRPTGIGGVVVAEARLVEQAGRILVFAVTASGDQAYAQGVVKRAIVDRAEFGA
jgi:fluoroacetyl-CoA thioesterase